MSKIKEHFNGLVQSRTIAKLKNRKAVIIAGSALASIGSASAEINITAITSAINAVTGIFPSIANMVSAAVEPILIIGVIGFVLKFWDNILDMIGNVTRFGK